MSLSLNENETELIGVHLFKDNEVIGDETCDRIWYLVENELEKVSSSNCGWDTLYLDLKGKRFWELIYPDSGLQGGGAPSLIYLPLELAKNKYEIPQNIINKIDCLCGYKNIYDKYMNDECSITEYQHRVESLLNENVENEEQFNMGNEFKNEIELIIYSIPDCDQKQEIELLSIKIEEFISKNFT